MGQRPLDDRWILEDAGEPIGMIVREEAGFVFYAAATDMWVLDRQIFGSAHAAREAAIDTLRRKRRRPPKQKITAGDGAERSNVRGV